MTGMTTKKRDPVITTLKQAKRAIKIVIGFSALIIGIVMIVLPGPATVMIPLALAILGTEFVWARKLLKRFKDQAKNMKNSIFNNTKNQKHKEEHATDTETDSRLPF